MSNDINNLIENIIQNTSLEAKINICHQILSNLKNDVPLDSQKSFNIHYLEQELDRTTKLLFVKDIKDSIEGWEFYQNATIDEMYELLKYTSDRVVIASIVQTLHFAQMQYPNIGVIYPPLLAGALSHYYPKAFFIVFDIFGVENVGTFVSGIHINGNINADDNLILQKADGRNIVTKALVAEKPVENTIKIANLTMGEIAQGDIFIKL